MDPASKSLSSKAKHDGLLLVNKPKGMGSKDVSRFLTRLTGLKKMGHVGTLDPMAEGVLPVLLGGATRLQDFFLAEKKIYEFDVSLGFATDTMDLEGVLVKKMPFDHVTKERVLEVISERFLGAIEQVPPLYSAIKVAGKPLYSYARSSEQVPVPLEDLTRKVHVFSLKLIGFEKDAGVLSFVVHCSKGTYVRSLGTDIAAALSTCGTISRLVRLATGEFDLDKSYSIDMIKRCWESNGSLHSLLVPIEQTKLPFLQVQIAEEKKVASLLQGQVVFLSKEEALLPSLESSEAMFLFTETSGRAFAIGKISCGGFFWKAQIKRSLL